MTTSTTTIVVSLCEFVVTSTYESLLFGSIIFQCVGIHCSVEQFEEYKEALQVFLVGGNYYEGEIM